MFGKQGKFQFSFIFLNAESFIDFTGSNQPKKLSKATDRPQ
jgi:hypothetical protein